MVCKTTVIGFYDSMGDASVDYCLKQTQFETMFCTAPYLKKLLDMRAQGLANFIKNIVLFDVNAETADLRQRASNEFSIKVYSLDDVREAGRSSNITLDPEAVGRDDIYMLNYTSGTTGDSKGVKVSQWGILSSAIIYMKTSGLNEDDVFIDYLPAPHVFDQFMFVACLKAGASQGYF